MADGEMDLLDAFMTEIGDVVAAQKAPDTSKAAEVEANADKLDEVMGGDDDGLTRQVAVEV